MVRHGELRGHLRHASGCVLAPLPSVHGSQAQRAAPRARHTSVLVAHGNPKGVSNPICPHWALGPPSPQTPCWASSQSVGHRPEMWGSSSVHIASSRVSPTRPAPRPFSARSCWGGHSRQVTGPHSGSHRASYHLHEVWTLLATLEADLPWPAPLQPLYATLA